jgi:hypothetical protein
MNNNYNQAQKQRYKKIAINRNAIKLKKQIQKKESEKNTIKYTTI